MALMPDLRIMGVIAALVMLLVAFVYWRAMKWMDTHQAWTK